MIRPKMTYSLPATFVNRGHRIIGVVALVACAVTVIVNVVLGGAAGTRMAAVAAAACVPAWLMFLRPKVEVQPGGVLLVNPVSTSFYPWTVIDDVDTQYQLAVVTAGRRRYAWALPAPGIGAATAEQVGALLRERRVRNAMSAAESERNTLPATRRKLGTAGVRPGDLDKYSVGVAAGVIRQSLEDIAAAAEKSAASGDGAAVGNDAVTADNSSGEATSHTVRHLGLIVAMTVSVTVIATMFVL